MFPRARPGAFVTDAIVAVTDVTYTGPSLALSKFPLMTCGASPGYMALTMVVCLGMRPTVLPAVPDPEPEPPAVQ